MNIIDLLALVPLYFQLIITATKTEHCYLDERFVIEIMFILRIFRMFRIFHLVKHYQALKILVCALKASLQELLMLSIFLIIGMLVFASMIYYAERQDANNSKNSKFTTIPMAFWWAIITMTTVGYGDVYPTTTIGYFVGTGCAVSGVLLVALTIPVISNNFSLFYTHVRSRSFKSQELQNTFAVGERYQDQVDDVDGEENAGKSVDSVLLETDMNGKSVSIQPIKTDHTGRQWSKFHGTRSLVDIVRKSCESEPTLHRSSSVCISKNRVHKNGSVMV